MSSILESYKKPLCFRLGSMESFSICFVLFRFCDLIWFSYFYIHYSFELSFGVVDLLFTCHFFLFILVFSHGIFVIFKLTEDHSDFTFLSLVFVVCLLFHYHSYVFFMEYGYLFF